MVFLIAFSDCSGRIYNSSKLPKPSISARAPDGKFTRQLTTAFHQRFLGFCCMLKGNLITHFITRNENADCLFSGVGVSKWCVLYGQPPGGEKPLCAWQQIASGAVQDVRREAKSEGSRMPGRSQKLEGRKVHNGSTGGQNAVNRRS